MGVAALSGVVDPDRLERGLEELRRMGFHPVPARNLLRRHGVFAGTDEERLEGFQQLASDASLRAIFFARGGHGVLRLLPRLDWELLERHPRAYVGYSDLTPFLLQVVKRLGLVAFHGPMVAVELAEAWTEREARSLLGALAGDYPQSVPLSGPATRDAVGSLVGGCLTMLTSTLGTPFAADLAGGLFFWEDTAEPAYRIDRMLHQLQLAGSLDRIRGMIVGRVESESACHAEEVEQLFRELGEKWPLSLGCPSGHCRPNLTLPLGLEARLAAGRPELVLGTGEAPA